jgi:hypothetical protein
MYYKDEWKLLDLYIKIYIQLLPYYHNGDIKHINQLPTFEEFKKYNLNSPNFKEAKRIVGNEIIPIYTAGLGSNDGICYRYYNYWLGCKFFIPDNIEGNYKFIYKELNDKIKKL